MSSMSDTSSKPSVPEGSILELPDILKQEVQSVFEETVPPLLPLIETPEARKVLACSKFVADYALCYPEELTGLLESDHHKNSVTRDYYWTKLQAALKDVEEDEDLMRVLRRFRNHEMVRIAWRDIAGHADLEETTEDLSQLADVMLDLTQKLLHERLVERFGRPQNLRGEDQQLVIIAMGKLGAHELNFSSDIDLIFAFPESGETVGSKKTLDNQDFFIRLGKQLIKTFNEITSDGFVFRVDMRLRPFGESGALALSFDAMEEYYVSHARDWERYAMIKASIAAGNKEAGAELMNMLTPFVYRRYLDFGAYQAIREMKEMINREVQRKGMESDVKLGAGGIREVEFIGQTFQLLRGGREPALQVRKILEVLAALEKVEILSAEEGEELRRAYCFLRNTEHRIQEIADQQTQALPTSELDQARIATGMGFEDWESFLALLARHRGRVIEHFGQLLRTEDEQDKDESKVDLNPLWRQVVDTQTALDDLQKVGFIDTEPALEMINRLRQGYSLQSLSKEGGERLDYLMPLVLQEVAKVECSPKQLANYQIVSLERVLKLIEAITKRSVYLALLKEYPQALNSLVKLCAASPWIAAYITSHPILLDELIDRESLYSPGDQEQLTRQLRDQLLHFPEDDLERQMDTLRHFRHSQLLRVAATDVSGYLKINEVSSHLSAIAEVILAAASDLAWRETVGRHGVPCCIDDGQSRQANFAIVAYGKLGGHELSYGSDLDVVFLHDSRGEDQFTDGKKEVENSVFFNRLGQRVIHILTVMTSAGRTYEIDTRLRPSGMSGFLVTGIDVFAEYQKNKAWTWEHQALVRARTVAGNVGLQKEFDKIRSEVLSFTRDKQQLKKDVSEMREKMRETLAKRIEGMFDLKQGAGGMADIEFIVQYIVLLSAADHEELLKHTDNLRLLEIMTNLNLLTSEQATLLRDAYFTYRDESHRLALQDKLAVVPEEECREYRAGVTAIWKEMLDSS